MNNFQGFVGKMVSPVSDIFAQNKDGTVDQSKKFFSKEKTYKILAVVDKPAAYCFIMANDFGFFDTVHFSNFIVPKDI